jgi:iron complex outermembrane receptor protein
MISDGFHSNDINWGVNISESVKLLKGTNLTIGGDYLTYGGKAENEIYNSFITDTSVYDAGLFGFIQQTLFNKLTLNAGLRVQNHQVYGTELIPSGGFAWQVSKNTTWKTSVAKGFRSPTIRELFVWNHNMNLNPESVMSYETGINQALLNSRLGLELTTYIVNGDNLIINVPAQGLQNAGEVHNKGIEFAANYNPSVNLSFNVTYSFIHMKNPVYATPEHNLYLSSNYRWNKLQLMASLQYVDNLDSDPSVTGTSFEKYTLINTGVSYRLAKPAELFLRVENILNQKYVNNIYYTMPGITVFGGFKIKI